MFALKIPELIAVYAALVSTIVALVQIFKALDNKPRLTVTVFNPSQISSNGHIFLSIISNTGSVAAVVESLEISFRTSRWFWGKEIGRAVFDESSRWKPSTKLAPKGDRPNSFVEEPNVIRPNEEIRAPAKAVENYEQHRHWIRVAAIPRNRGRRFIGWAPPVVSTGSTETEASE